MTTNMTTVEQHRYLFENQLKHAMPFGCHFIGTFASESSASWTSTLFTSGDLTGDKSFHKWATTTGALNQLRLVPRLNGSSGWNHIPVCMFHTRLKTFRLENPVHPRKCSQQVCHCSDGSRWAGVVLPLLLGVYLPLSELLSDGFGESSS